MTAPDDTQGIIAVVVAVDSPLGRAVEAVDKLTAHLPSPREPQECPLCLEQSWPCHGFYAAALHHSVIEAETRLAPGVVFKTLAVMLKEKLVIQVEPGYGDPHEGQPSGIRYILASDGYMAATEELAPDQARKSANYAMSDEKTLTWRMLFALRYSSRALNLCDFLLQIPEANLHDLLKSLHEFHENGITRKIIKHRNAYHVLTLPGALMARFVMEFGHSAKNSLDLDTLIEIMAVYNRGRRDCGNDRLMVKLMNDRNGGSRALTTSAKRARQPVVTNLHEKALLLLAKQREMTPRAVIEGLSVGPDANEVSAKKVYRALAYLRQRSFVQTAGTGKNVRYAVTDAGLAEAQEIQDAVNRGPELKRQYESGRSIKNMAVAAGVGCATMYRYLELLGAEMRRNPGQPRYAWRKHLPDWLVRYNNGKGESIRDIAEKSGFAFGTVRKALKEGSAQIAEPRPRPDSTRVARMTDVSSAVLHVLSTHKRRLRVREIRRHIVGVTSNEVHRSAHVLEKLGYAAGAVVDGVGWYWISDSGREAVKDIPRPDICKDPHRLSL
ncbi:hypothetical protein [Kibdelosporangium aridum]|uniref:Uncharacterized protein n=1 Tax=Kibdelosporangium aridum TaxID=2030 RepID=A0A1W2FZS7_KIBAR|nr:hypothetical protein [Kibdelosporangium aridum]SMD27469.1 hypothetical protein SAMN05661093_11076 [Kibdelosporangium aridum]